MDIKDAKYILSIYKNNSISKAAKELYISQPSVSKYLQNLENRLGAPLFDRTNNNYELTHLGKRYLSYAENLIDINVAWENECKSIVDNINGKLTISLPLTRSFCLIPDIFSDFNKKFPHVCIELIEESYLLSEDFVLNQDIDFAIFNTTHLPEHIEYQELFEEQIVLVCRKNSTLKTFAKKICHSDLECIDIKIVKHENIIMLSSIQYTGLFIQNLFLEYHITPNIILTTRSHHTAIELASQGVGICFVPLSYVKKLKNYHNIDFYGIEHVESKSKLILGYRKNKYITEYAQYFIDLVKECF